MACRIWLCLSGALYLSLSCVLFVKTPDLYSHLEADSGIFFSQAERFLKQGSFFDRINPGPLYHVSAGYSALLALLFFFFGKSLLAIIVVNMLCGLGIIYCVYRLSSYFFPEPVSVLATFLASINGAYLVFTQFVLTEMLLAFLLLFAFERFVNFLYTKNKGALFFSGFVYGYSLMVKPAALYYILFLAFLLMLVHRSIKLVSVFFLPTLACGLLYCYHNKIVFGEFELSSAQRLNLYHYFLPQVMMRSCGLSEQQAHNILISLSPRPRHLPEKPTPELREFFYRTLLAHKLLALRIWLENVARTCLGLYTNHFKILLNPAIKKEYGGAFRKFNGSLPDRLVGYINYGTSSWAVRTLAVVEIVFNFIKYVSVAYALIFLVFRRRWLELILLGSFTFYFLLITGHHGCARFRSMAEGVLTILFALGVFLFFKQDFFMISKRGLYED